MISISPSCEGVCWQYTANQKRIPWSKVGTFLRIDVKSEVEMIVETEGWEDRVEILARADFNGDELEDLILKTTGGATKGTGVSPSPVSLLPQRQNRRTVVHRRIELSTAFFLVDLNPGSIGP